MTEKERVVREVEQVSDERREVSILWKYETGDWVKSVSISSDGEYIAAGSFDNYVYLFNREGKLLWKYETGDWVWSVSISSDGEYIAAGSNDRNVYLFVSLHQYQKQIDEAKATISQIKSKYNVEEAETLLSQAESAFNEKDYSKAGELALKAKEKAIEIGKQAEEVEEAMEEAKKTISEESSYNVQEAKITISKSESAFKAGKYDEAHSYALKAKSLALDIDQDGIPNREDFAPYIKNEYIYASGITILLVSAFSGG